MTKQKVKRWAISLDGVGFDDYYPTEKEAIQQGKFHYQGEPFYIGEEHDYPLDWAFDIDVLLEEMAVAFSNTAYYELEVDEEVVVNDITTQAVDTFNQFFEQWLKDNNVFPNLTYITNIRQIDEND